MMLSETQILRNTNVAFSTVAVYIGGNLIVLATGVGIVVDAGALSRYGDSGCKS
jgi:hypothetical protein